MDAVIVMIEETDETREQDLVEEYMRMALKAQYYLHSLIGEIHCKKTRKHKHNAVSEEEEEEELLRVEYDVE